MSGELATCAVCGEEIDPAEGEVPVWIGDGLEIGEYDGAAYHLETCEDDVFDTVHCEVDG